MNKNKQSGEKILLVEDEESLALGLNYNLTEEGYTVEWAKDGREALKVFQSSQFDLIILDIMLPFLNGFEVAEKIREQSPQIPILILTARTASGDRIKGLEMGADDYLTKPFHLQELLIRIKGMLKRRSWYRAITEKTPLYRFGNVEINFENLSTRVGKKEFRLTQREAMVLRFLIENKNRTVTRKELLENVWKISSDIETRTVDNFIMRLRKYFEPDPLHPKYIKSVRGVGYIFDD